MQTYFPIDYLAPVFLDIDIDYIAPDYLAPPIDYLAPVAKRHRRPPTTAGSRDPEKNHFDPIVTFELVRIEKCIFPECKMYFWHSANCIQTTHDQGPRMSRRKAAPPQYRLFTLNSPPSTPIRPNQTRGGGRCCDSDGSICLRCRIVTLFQQRPPFSRLC